MNNGISLSESAHNVPLVAPTSIQEQQCDHKGHWHLCPGSYRIVRFCGGCGKSWWIPAKDETLSFDGEVTTLEWEPINEYAEVPPLRPSFYDDPNPFVDDNDDIGDDDFPG